MDTVSQVELSKDVEPPETPDDEALRFVLLRWKGRPVGRLVIEGHGFSDSESFRRAAMEAAAPGLRSIEGELAEGAVPASSISVIIATRDRPADLRGCLAALGRLEPLPGEVLVVDSASESKREIAETTEGAGAKYIRLEEPGLSRARNAGADPARGELLAFLDDDCQVDSAWLEALCLSFAKSRVDAVAGLLLPVELETPAQTFFMRYSHMDRRGFVPRSFHRDVPESRYWPLDVWRVGSGGNLAVRKEVFHRLQGFDTSLGLGTPACGGEDLFFLYQLLRTGGTIEYRPDAMAWHRHHRTFSSLKRVMFGYGKGHTAYLRAAFSAGAPHRQAGLYRLSFYFDRIKRLIRCFTGRSSYPASLVFNELAGSFAGVWSGRS